MDKTRFPQLLQAIYDAVDELEVMFPGRHFTPDGHLAGSLGEALASYHYGVELSPASAHCHDGKCGGPFTSYADFMSITRPDDFSMVTTTNPERMRSAIH